VHGARGLFKLDYWANSYAEAVQGLEEYLRAEYGAEFMEHDFTVAVCGPPGSAGYYFPSNFIYTPDRAQAQFFIAFTKDNCDKAVPGRVIYRVERMATLLSLVIDRREILARTARLDGGT
jgi:predicted Zn-dependent protease